MDAISTIPAFLAGNIHKRTQQTCTNQQQLEVPQLYSQVEFSALNIKTSLVAGACTPRPLYLGFITSRNSCQNSWIHHWIVTCTIIFQLCSNVYDCLLIIQLDISSYKHTPTRGLRLLYIQTETCLSILSLLHCQLQQKHIENVYEN